MHLNRNRVSPQKNFKLKPKGKNKSDKKGINKNVTPILKLKMNQKSDVRIKIHHKHKLEDLNEQKESNRPISKWSNILRGHTAFILGNAPSILNYNLSLLDNYFTIGINRIFYIYDPTLLIWQDQQIWNKDKKMLLKQQAIKVSSVAGDPKHYFMNFKVEGGQFRFTNDPSILHGYGNTGALAVQLAISMGCSNIVLLGTDCRYSEGKKTDFYGINKDHKPYTLKMCSSAMKWVRDNCPVPVYNCSENKYWDKEKLEDVIEKIKPQKMSRQQYQDIFRR